jgi:uncharacterized protein involved in exopolysaccharide biosynthesis
MPSKSEPTLPGFDEPVVTDYDSRTRPIDRLLYVVGAARRRRKVVLSVFFGGFALLALYYAFATPVYRVEARILAQRYQAPAIGRQAGTEDAPTRSAWELIHRRENLIALAKQTGLIADLGPPTKPGPVKRLWQAILRGQAPTEDDPMEALVLRLDKQLLVTTAGGTVDIEVDWPDAQQAYRIVEAAVQNFLEARHLQEITAIDETISLLQGRVATLRKQLDDVIDEVSLQARRQASRTVTASPTGRVVEALPPQASQELVRLKSMLDAKERAIGDVEEFRRRRLADLQAQLDAQRAIYSDAHPNIITLRRDIDALSRESPQIGALREEERRLRQEYTSRAASENVRPVPAVSATPSLAAASSRPSSSVDENERVREARYRYQQMVERMNQAELELDAGRAAFKYRYDVIWPAQIPKQPVSPTPVKVFGLGGFALLILSLAVATWLDWRSGVVLERWQIERELDLPVLGDLSRG